MGREHVLVDLKPPMCSSPVLPQSQAASSQPLSRAPGLFTHKCHQVGLTASPERVCSMGVSPAAWQVSQALGPPPLAPSSGPKINWRESCRRELSRPRGFPITTPATGRPDPELECTKIITFNSHNGLLRLALLAPFHK